MDDEAEQLRQQMMDTRTALSEKLENLENQVIGTVQDATSAVNETVAAVKDAVQDTVDTVKDTVQGTVGSMKDTMQETVTSVRENLSLERQFQHHPWAMLGGAVAVGFLGTRLLGNQGRGTPAIQAQPDVKVWEHAPRLGQAKNGAKSKAPRLAAPPEERENWLAKLGDQFAPEINKLRGAAIGATFALIRDLVSPSLPPPLQQTVREVLDGATAKLGGEPMRESILSPEASRPTLANRWAS
jgi:ElaB/YqjD/DUF883 family membrane-anchored ribosome-binding protein